MDFVNNEIKLNRDLSELDKFALDFLQILEKHTEYVIVSGYGRMVGSVNNKTYPEYLKFNCAGRNIHPLLTKENLKAEFQKYSQEQGDKNRKLALKYNNIENTVQNFLDLYNYRNLNI